MIENGNDFMTNWIYSYLKYSHLLTPDQEKRIVKRFYQELKDQREELKDVPEELLKA